MDDDGFRLDAATVTADRITEDADYEGIRVKFWGYLENSRVPIQIDLGFGDVITPAPVETKIPSLLPDLPASKLLAYPKESVIAEKFEAMVSLGIANSRMKDIHDIQSLSRGFSFNGSILLEAINKTFAVRGTRLPLAAPLVFTVEFFDDPEKKRQWAAFCHKNRGYVIETSLQSVCDEVSSFLTPIIHALNSNSAMSKKWSAGTWI